MPAAIFIAVVLAVFALWLSLPDEPKNTALDWIHDLVAPRTVWIPITPPSQNKDQPHVEKLARAAPATRQDPILRLVLANPLDKSVILDRWKVSWRYYPGHLAGIARAEEIKPSHRDYVVLNISTGDESTTDKYVTFDNTIVMPAASPDGPSIYAQEFKLIYKFDQPHDHHTSYEWNIFMNLDIETTDGVSIPVLENFKWRALSSQ